MSPLFKRNRNAVENLPEYAPAGFLLKTCFWPKSGNGVSGGCKANASDGNETDLRHHIHRNGIFNGYGCNSVAAAILSHDSHWQFLRALRRFDRLSDHKSATGR